VTWKEKRYADLGEDFAPASEMRTTIASSTGSTAARPRSNAANAWSKLKMLAEKRLQKELKDVFDDV
jgi:hypothetical protein